MLHSAKRHSLLIKRAGLLVEIAAKRSRSRCLYSDFISQTTRLLFWVQIINTHLQFTNAIPSPSDGLIYADTLSRAPAVCV